MVEKGGHALPAGCMSGLSGPFGKRRGLLGLQKLRLFGLPVESGFQVEIMKLDLHLCNMGSGRKEEE